jgi:hypothetical protein
VCDLLRGLTVDPAHPSGSWFRLPCGRDGPVQPVHIKALTPERRIMLLSILAAIAAAAGADLQGAFQVVVAFIGRGRHALQVGDLDMAAAVADEAVYAQFLAGQVDTGPANAQGTSQLLGSRSGLPSNHASRRVRMSRRSCSQACAVFF